MDIKKQIKNYDLILKAKQDDINSIEELLKIYDGLIKKIACYYFYHLKITHLELRELVTEGQIGFLNAIEKFDISKGYELSTFATYNIRNNILNALRKSSIIKHSTRDIMMQINKNKKNDIEKNLDEKRTIFTLNFVGDTNKMELYVNYSSDANNNIFENVVENEVVSDKAINMQELIYEAIDSLNDKERLIILNFFGFNKHKRITLREISGKYAIPYQEVRKIKNKAMSKLKRILKTCNNNKVQVINK